MEWQFRALVLTCDRCCRCHSGQAHKSSTTKMAPYHRSVSASGRIDPRLLLSMIVDDGLPVLFLRQFLRPKMILRVGNSPILTILRTNMAVEPTWQSNQHGSRTNMHTGCFRPCSSTKTTTPQPRTSFVLCEIELTGRCLRVRKWFEIPPVHLSLNSQLLQTSVSMNAVEMKAKLEGLPKPPVPSLAHFLS